LARRIVCGGGGAHRSPRFFNYCENPLKNWAASEDVVVPPALCESMPTLRRSAACKNGLQKLRPRLAVQSITRAGGLRIIARLGRVPAIIWLLCTALAKSEKRSRYAAAEGGQLLFAQILRRNDMKALLKEVLEKLREGGGTRDFAAAD